MDGEGSHLGTLLAAGRIRIHVEKLTALVEENSGICVKR